MSTSASSTVSTNQYTIYLQQAANTPVAVINKFAIWLYNRAPGLFVDQQTARQYAFYIYQHNIPRFKYLLSEYFKEHDYEAKSFTFNNPNNNHSVGGAYGQEEHMYAREPRLFSVISPMPFFYKGYYYPKY